MHTSAFNEQLAILAAEYALLEDENELLRSMLQGPSGAACSAKEDLPWDEVAEVGLMWKLQEPQWTPVEEAASGSVEVEPFPLVHKGGRRDVQFGLALEHCVESLPPQRTFRHEVAHGVALDSIVPGCLEEQRLPSDDIRPFRGPGHDIRLCPGPAEGPWMPSPSPPMSEPEPLEDGELEPSEPSSPEIPMWKRFSATNSARSGTSQVLSVTDTDTHPASNGGGVANAAASRPRLTADDAVFSDPPAKVRLSVCSKRSSNEDSIKDSMKDSSATSGTGRRGSKDSGSSSVSSATPESERSGGSESFDLIPSCVYKREAVPMFTNLDQMKAKVLANLVVNQYDVTGFYKDSGICQFVSRHQAFDTASLIIIGLNAIWIAVETDHNHEKLLVDAHPVFQVGAHLFCTYFTFEALVRFGAFKRKRDCLRDLWFLFDSSLAFLMIVDTWAIEVVLILVSNEGSGGSGGTDLSNASILRMARLLRLLRMARMARLLRALPELLVLIKGMAAAARSVFFTLMLLLVLLYVFGIAFTQLLANEDVGKEHFYSVSKSMHTLWLYGTLLDEITTLMEQLEGQSFCVVLLNVYILLAALTVMNMLVGVLCEVVQAVAASEREEASLRLVKSKVERIFFENKKDKDNDTISKQEFQRIIENQEAARALQALGVDVVQMVDMADTLFASDIDSSDFKELSFGEFMEAVVKLRGDNFATVKDLVNLQKFVNKQTMKLLSGLTGIERLARLSCSTLPGLQRRQSLSGNALTGEPSNPQRRVSHSKTLGHLGLPQDGFANRRASSSSRRNSLFSEDGNRTSANANFAAHLAKNIAEAEEKSTAGKPEKKKVANYLRNW
jgi:voltage-gated sodium channel